jgi:sugar phosphate isomerase/epimerase
MPASDTLGYEQNLEFHRRRLSDIADALAPHNLRLAIGFTSIPAHRKDKQHEFVCRVDQLLALLDAVQRPNVGAIVDTWHWHFGGGGVAQARQLGRGRIAMVRVANAAADADPQQATEKGRLLPSAEGAIDNVAWLTTLGEMEYEGGVTPYPHASQFRGSTRERIVASVAESLTAVWKSAGLNRAGKLAPEEEPEAAPAE